MPNNKENLDKIIRLALEKHSLFLSQLDNVHGLGIINIKKTKPIESDSVKEQDEELVLAVYVTKKISEENLAVNQIIPKTLEVKIENKLYEVNTKVIEQEQNYFETETL